MLEESAESRKPTDGASMKAVKQGDVYSQWISIQAVEQEFPDGMFCVECGKEIVGGRIWGLAGYADAYCTRKCARNSKAKIPQGE